MLNKELLYTMITRASKKFILCAQTKALQYAITKEQIIHRQTYLMDDLDELCNKKFDF
jgi:exodeoxyribonuclease V alpha subunit